MNLDWSEHRLQHKNPVRMYLKFLTSLIPCVKKILNLHGVQISLHAKEYKHIIYAGVTVNHNGMAAHLTRCNCEGF
jgi:hypothetical protein